MKSVEQLRNETAEDLGYIDYFDFEKQVRKGVKFADIEIFMEQYATNRVKEVENYYKNDNDHE